MRMPSGDHGVAVAARPSATSAASASSRVVFSGLTRRSNGAGVSHARASALRSASPICRAQPLPQPVGKVVRDRRRQRVVQPRLEGPQPDFVGRVERGLEVAQRPAELAHERGDGEPSRLGARGQRLERAHPPQQREHAVGDEGAVLLPHFRVRAEERAQPVVGRRVEAANALDRGGQRRELVGADAHATFLTRTSTRRRESNRARPRRCRGRYSSRGS